MTTMIEAITVTSNLLTSNTLKVAPGFMEK